MTACARTYMLEGLEAHPVTIEVDVHRGLPAFSVVGLPDAAVRESRERVRAALVNSGFEFPLKRIVANLAPVCLRKAGPGMDLAIATALLVASGQLDWGANEPPVMVGELALDGTVRPIAGVLPIAEAAREQGVKAIAVPATNGPEAALATGIEVIPVAHLGELRAIVSGTSPTRPSPLLLSTEREGGPDLADLRGQHDLRRALEVAAAGGHSLLIVGPPGAGKSLAASRVPSILPPLSDSEALEVARIASACGRLQGGLGGRPFRAPHHTISAAGLIGGGNPLRPGEVTLAHRGVLYLDELPEFRRDALEALGGALINGSARVARAGSRQQLPSRFMFVAAANPCPCGRGDADPDCCCSPVAIQRYLARLNGAFDERIDIVIEAQPPGRAEIGGPPGEPSKLVRERVIAARERQERRMGSGCTNAQAESMAVSQFVVSDGAQQLLDRYLGPFDRIGGARCTRVLRVARTLADLAGADAVGEEQILEALLLAGGRRG
jgi:magnesium chelatase family protein